MSVRTTVIVDGEPHTVEVDGRDDALTARVDGAALGFALARPRGDTWRVTLPDRMLTATVVRERDTVWIAIDGEIHRCTASTDPRSSGRAGTRVPRMTAPMPGKVLAVRVAVGQSVAAGDPLVVLEAMKMETIVSAEADGTVKEVHVGAGELVEPGQLLIVLAYE